MLQWLFLLDGLGVIPGGPMATNEGLFGAEGASKVIAAVLQEINVYLLQQILQPMFFLNIYYY